MASRTLTMTSLSESTQVVAAVSVVAGRHLGRHDGRHVLLPEHAGLAEDARKGVAPRATPPPRAVEGRHLVANLLAGHAAEHAAAAELEAVSIALGGELELPLVCRPALARPAHLQAGLDQHWAVAQQAAHVGQHAAHARSVDHLGRHDDTPLLACRLYLQPPAPCRRGTLGRRRCAGGDDELDFGRGAVTEAAAV
eukprot:scaffold89055_cov60-Phaeocystis_antarctica.AAC.2